MGKCECVFDQTGGEMHAWYAQRQRGASKMGTQVMPVRQHGTVTQLQSVPDAGRLRLPQICM